MAELLDDLDLRLTPMAGAKDIEWDGELDLSYLDASAPVAATPAESQPDTDDAAVQITVTSPPRNPADGASSEVVVEESAKGEAEADAEVDAEVEVDTEGVVQGEDNITKAREFAQAVAEAGDRGDAVTSYAADAEKAEPEETSHPALQAEGEAADEDQAHHIVGRPTGILHPVSATPETEPALDVEGEDPPDPGPSISVRYHKKTYPLFHGDDVLGFFDDVGVLESEMDDLLASFRQELVEDLSEKEALVLRVQDLGLEYSECTRSGHLGVSLTQIYDLFVQLKRNEGISDCPTMTLLLSTRPSPTHRFDELAEAAENGVGISSVQFTFAESIELDDEESEGSDDEDMQDAADEYVEDQMEEDSDFEAEAEAFVEEIQDEAEAEAGLEAAEHLEDELQQLESEADVVEKEPQLADDEQPNAEPQEEPEEEVLYDEEDEDYVEEALDQAVDDALNQQVDVALNTQNTAEIAFENTNVEAVENVEDLQESSASDELDTNVEATPVPPTEPAPRTDLDAEEAAEAEFFQTAEAQAQSHETSDQSGAGEEGDVEDEEFELDINPGDEQGDLDVATLGVEQVEGAEASLAVDSAKVDSTAMLTPAGSPPSLKRPLDDDEAPQKRRRVSAVGN